MSYESGGTDVNPLWIPALQYGIPSLAVIAAAWLGRRAGHKSADAAVAASAAAHRQADAAMSEAQAAVRTADAAVASASAEIKKAAAAEREAAMREWAAITEGMQRWNQALQSEISEMADRIDAAELRALADKERADKADQLRWKAIIYLRKLLRWIDETVPGEKYPPIPEELKVDL